MRESQYNVWVERNGSFYVFNSVSGSLYRMTAEQHTGYRRFIADGSPDDCAPETLASLVAGRMIITDNANELATLEKRYEASRRDHSHFALTIVTSLGCNFDCPYCFEAKHPSIMDSEVRRQVLNVVDDQLQRVDAFDVTWFGGEPLVGRQPLLELSDAFIERCDSHQVHYGASIITNGFLLDEKTCEALRARKVRFAQIGLDGPPAVHDRMRPLAGGRGSFAQILDNIKTAVDYMTVQVRVNIDTANFEKVEALFEILADAGLAGRVTVSAGHIVGAQTNLLAPSASYSGCLTRNEFSRFERDFHALAQRYGLSAPALPRQITTPCTAVRSNELVVGSRGELYKCWNSVGDAMDVIGHISHYSDHNGRMAKWMSYDPFSDAECSGCVALPVCMGGCAYHAFEDLQHENRCSTFRHTYYDQICDYIDYAERRGITAPVPAFKLERGIAAARVG